MDPVMNEELRKKFAGVNSLDGLFDIIKAEFSLRIRYSDLIADLMTLDNERPLAASQGKILKDMIDTLMTGDGSVKNSEKFGGLTLENFVRFSHVVDNLSFYSDYETKVPSLKLIRDLDLTLRESITNINITIVQELKDLDERVSQELEEVQQKVEDVNTELKEELTDFKEDVKGNMEDVKESLEQVVTDVNENIHQELEKIDQVVQSFTEIDVVRLKELWDLAQTVT